MNRYRFWYITLALVALIGLTSQPAGANAPSQAQTPEGSGPYVSQPVTPVLSQPLRDLPPGTFSPTTQVPNRVNPDPGRPSINLSGPPDPLRAFHIFDQSRTPNPQLTFEGANGTPVTPPDTNGDVGPNHYVQIVNELFAIYDKSGGLQVGPNSLNSIFTNLGGNCATNGEGDPVALYDPLADRWLLSQFTGNNDVCVAISKTADATGAYWLYQFPMAHFPDYFKFGVWPDAYYMSSNEDSYTAYAFDRAQMLAGQAATFQRFSGQDNLLLPSDVDGSTPPPAGAPNYFYTFKDDAFHGGADRLEVYAFHSDWITPTNSTFTLAATIPISSFTYTVCGYFVFDCIPQGGTTQKVDAVSEWPMHRLAYRNFGDHETLVGNFSVDVGSDQAGIRWFELRKVGADPWNLYQEGTQAPDSLHRWMGSIAMDRAGNIALGYSASSSSDFPSIRYATRLASDPLGTLGSEMVMLAGGGSQTGSDRWGDYSAMSVDPADDCTFWYTQEYYPVSSAYSWHTRVGAFRIPSCLPADVAITSTASANIVTPGAAISYTLTVTSTPSITASVTITDNFSTGLTVNNVDGAGWICTWDNTQAQCDASDLSLVAPIEVSATAPITPGLITDTAIVTGDFFDIQPSNNIAHVAVLVDALPAISTGPDIIIHEGETISQTGSFTDTDSITWTATVNYGDGSGLQALILSPAKTFELNHLYPQNGVYTVTVTVNDGTDNGSGHLDVTVLNVAPALNPLPNQSVNVGETVTVTGVFTDPGLLDKHRIVIEWSPGITESLELAAGEASFTLDHHYVIAGIYTVTVTLIDQDAGQDVRTLTITVKLYRLFLPLVIH